MLRGMTVEHGRQLLERIGGERAFFEADGRTLMSVAGMRSRIFEDDYRRQILDKARREADFVSSHNIGLTYWRDDSYPRRLMECVDAPLMLYGVGDCDLNRCKTVGVVGTRHATPYGIDFVNRLVQDLAAEVEGEVAVVSGLALGIDAAAHNASLKHGLRTVGVLGHGLNTIYPAEHRNMAAEMVKRGGGLLTEYGAGDAIHRGNFVARNRIVAGLCDCVVVAESAVKGGAMITARLAAGYDRDVLALPGRISDRYSAGCNELIATHVAAMVRDAGDLMNLMGWTRRKPADEPQQLSLFAELGAEEQAVVDYLTQNDGAMLNAMSVALNMSAGRLMALLVDMEFRGYVMSYPGGRYRLA